MNAAALIQSFAARGVRLTPDGDSLVVEPASRLTNDDRVVIREHKPELLARFSAEHERAEIERIARLDAERREADRLRGRGYDVDCAHPDHAEFLERTGRRCACQDAVPCPHGCDRHTCADCSIDAIARRDGDFVDELIGYSAKAERELARSVRIELERIWPEAKRLGWPRERIWGASFWPVEARGLAALLDHGDEIVEVSAEYITILKMRRDVLRFRRSAA